MPVQVFYVTSFFCLIAFLFVVSSIACRIVQSIYPNSSDILKLLYGNIPAPMKCPGQQYNEEYGETQQREVWVIFTVSNICSYLGPVLLTWINLSNNIPSKVWDEITCPITNFNGCIIEIWEWIKNFIPQFIIWAIHFPMLWLKLTRHSMIRLMTRSWYHCLPKTCFMWKLLPMTPDKQQCAWLPYM